MMSQLPYYILLYFFLCMAAFIGYRRKKCGGMHITIPPEKIYRIYWSCLAGLSLAVFTREIFSAYSSHRLIPTGFLLIICMFAVYFQHGKVRITNTGILYYYSLLEWSNIISWDWDKDHLGLLLLTYSRPGGSPPEAELHCQVPVNLIRQVTEVLEYRSPKTPLPEPIAVRSRPVNKRRSPSAKLSQGQK